ncbi:3(2),5-bisphosphate nucleotidase HAL2 [Ganoderma leucocontextum]|nr:3(2),5-bisphosphate nucleotidase HAL2 [Ganoderma leucocontextum]
MLMISSSATAVCALVCPGWIWSTLTQIVITAVRRACWRLVKQETSTKDDKSPVTAGDFPAQAVVNTILHRTFTDDPIVGEEDASDLRILRDRIIELANETLTAELHPGEKTADQLLDAIDRESYTGVKGREWHVDPRPHHGTKGFLRGEQRTVCLVLLVDTCVELRLMDCLNSPFPLAPAAASSSPSGAPAKLTIPTLTQETLNFLESRVGQVLGVTRAPTRMDSQAKYCSLARGDGGVYLRMPDHAAGAILVEEAGGRTLGENYGIVASGKDVHPKVIAAIKQAKAEEGQSQL